MPVTTDEERDVRTRVPWDEGEGVAAAIAG